MKKKNGVSTWVRKLQVYRIKKNFKRENRWKKNPSRNLSYKFKKIRNGKSQFA